MFANDYWFIGEIWRFKIAGLYNGVVLAAPNASSLLILSKLFNVLLLDLGIIDLLLTWVWVRFLAWVYWSDCRGEDYASAAKLCIDCEVSKSKIILFINFINIFSLQ